MVDMPVGKREVATSVVPVGRKIHPLHYSQRCDGKNPVVDAVRMLVDEDKGPRRSWRLKCPKLGYVAWKRGIESSNVPAFSHGIAAARPAILGIASKTHRPWRWP